MPFVNKDEAIKAIVEHPSKIAIYTKKAIIAIEELPTAKVVPEEDYLNLFAKLESAEKENERLRHILDLYALQYGTVQDLGIKKDT